MKTILTVFFASTIVSLGSQETIKEEYLRKLHNGDFQIAREWTNTSFPKLTEEGGQIIAVLNQYGDRVIENIQKIIMRNGMDPVELPSESLKLIPWGKITLSEGWLQNLSTLSRNTDIKVIYRSSKKTIELQVPVEFEVLTFDVVFTGQPYMKKIVIGLSFYCRDKKTDHSKLTKLLHPTNKLKVKFTYDYSTQVFPLTINGGLEGRLEDVKINIILSFDYRTYEAHMDNFDIRHSGNISIRFTGHGLLDWITNAMTSVVTLFLKPIILNIVDWLLKDSLDSIVDVINKAIHCILHSSKS